jgi:hypothetical protein
MATIRTVKKRFARLDVYQVAMDVLVKEKNRVIDLNLDQLKKGYTKFGGRLAEYKSDSYAWSKNIQNPEAGYGNPDLNRTGEFWKKFRLVVNSHIEYEIFSSDSKAHSLERKYGDENIYGMGEDSKDEFIRNGYRSLFYAAIRKKVKL